MSIIIHVLSVAYIILTIPVLAAAAWTVLVVARRRYCAALAETSATPAAVEEEDDPSEEVIIVLPWLEDADADEVVLDLRAIPTVGGVH